MTGITFDTHVHSYYSTDSRTPIREQLERAAALGLQGICLTDHMDYDFPPEQFERTLPEGEKPFEFDIRAYQRELERLRADYSSLTILTGVECGLQLLPAILKKNKSLSSDSGLDYIIGSLHLVNRQDLYYRRFWEGREPSRCVRQYFEELYENICTFTDFDSLGHLDYIVRYAPDSYHYEPSAYRDILEEILRQIIRKDIALEVNTSGFRFGSQPNPHSWVLHLYRELGGELITVGSDAHTPELLANHFREAASVLKKAGLHQYAAFRQHKPEFHDISY